MKVREGRVAGLKMIEPAVHGDARGFFFEGWHRERYAQHGIRFDVVQWNVSRSARHVLRGLHYQWPNPQGKLVAVLEGEVWDVAVDIRRGSPTFGQWDACVLTGENQRQFWIPEGFAHGFAVLSDSAIVHYLCTAAYDASTETGIRWNDATLAIDWPLSEPLLSGKDVAAPFLADVPPERLPVYAP